MTLPEVIPDQFVLLENYPNPFNPKTTLRFSLNQPAKVTLTVHNLLGQQVSRLISGKSMQSGRHARIFDASPLSSGIYVARLTVQSPGKKAISVTRKMICME